MNRNTMPSNLIPMLLIALLAVTNAAAEDKKDREELKEPVLRVAKRSDVATDEHPLDPALARARDALERIRSEVNDYTCTLVKRERINGNLGDYEYMFAKIRNRKVEGEKIVTPFSVYLYFLKPATAKGREVLYVEGQNNGKMIAHEGGLTGKYLPTVWLNPTGIIAMRNQLYPLTDVGLENLVLKLIERGERERKLGHDNVEVTFNEGAKINGRSCTLLQIKHPKPAANLDFHLAQIFIDDEMHLPIRYAAFGWPGQEGEQPPVLEEYTYLNLKLNAGLTDKDFDDKNDKYNFH